MAKIDIVGPEIHRKALETVLEDVMRAGHVNDDAVNLEDGPSPEATRFAVKVTLAEEMPE